MCLVTIDSKKPNSVGKGYKIFRIRKGKLYALYAYVKGGYPLRRWLKVSDYKPRSVAECAKIYDYRPGYHIFIDKEDAEKYVDLFYENSKSVCIKRVEYRGAYISGLTSIAWWLESSVAETIVAEEMRIQK